MKTPLKIFLFVTLPIWFLPFLIGGIIKLMYDDFSDWIAPKKEKDKVKFKGMTHYDA